MSFLVKPSSIQNKVVDTSFLATDYTFLPASLGVRTQTLTLSFADSGIKATFLSPLISYRDAISRFGVSIHEIESAVSSGRFFERNYKRDALLKSGISSNDVGSRLWAPLKEPGSTISSESSFLRAFIGEMVSIIYFPIYIKRNAIYDAILNRPISKLDARHADNFSRPDKKRDWAIQFISAQCPDCGWDLTGERQSISLFCKNCDTAWRVSQGKFKKLSYSAVTYKDKNVVFLPFWRMEVQISGVDLNSYADLIRIANLPRAIKKEWEKIGIFFWAPAFKLQPRMFLRLAKQITIFQPSEELEEAIPTSILHPVSLDSNEALESITITLAHMAVNKKKIFPLLPNVKIKLKKAVLVYLPFTVRGNEFIQTQMKFSIQRNALRE